MVLHPFEVEQRMGVGIPAEDRFEEGTAGGEDDFVGLDLFVVAGKGDVEEVLVVPKLAKSQTDIVLKVVPAQAELFTAHTETWCSPFPAVPPVVSLQMLEYLNFDREQRLQLFLGFFAAVQFTQRSCSSGFHSYWPDKL